MKGTYEDAIRNKTVFKTQLASRVVDKKNPTPKSKRDHAFFIRPTIPDAQDITHAYHMDAVLDAVLQKYAKPEDPSCIVRSVTLTETFEEEEIFELSPEEKREAEEDLENERLRMTNPVEYKRREQERMARMRRDLNAGPIGGAVTNSIGCESTIQQQPPPLPCEGGTRIRRLIKIQVPEHMRGANRSANPNSDAPHENAGPPTVPGVAEVQTHSVTANDSKGPDILPSIRPVREVPPTAQIPGQPHPGAPFLGSLVSTTSVFASKPPASTQPQATSPKLDFRSSLKPQNGASKSAPTTKSLEPVLGKHTHYKESPTPQAPLSRTTSLEGKEAALLAALRVSLTTRGEEARQMGFEPRLTPQDVTNAASNTLDTRKLKGYPRVDVLQNLEKYIRENTRFADVLLSGRLDVGNAIDMSRSQLEKLSAHYSSMTEPSFTAEVWNSQGTPDVGSNYQPPAKS